MKKTVEVTGKLPENAKLVAAMTFLSKIEHIVEKSNRNVDIELCN